VSAHWIRPSLLKEWLQSPGFTADAAVWRQCKWGSII